MVAVRPVGQSCDGALVLPPVRICRNVVRRDGFARPCSGHLCQCANTADMCRTLAATVSAGIAINKALPFAADACGNHFFSVRSEASLSAGKRR